MDLATGQQRQGSDKMTETISDNYQALVVKAVITPHPNADRLAICSAMGYTILVSKEVRTGDLLLFFEQGTQLSEEFCNAHSLCKKDGGMFDDKKRLVKAISLRGVRSEGFCIEASKLGSGWESLKEGDQISTWAGKEICRKYVSEEVKAARTASTGRQQERTSRVHVKRALFPEHESTAHFRRQLSHIPTGSVLYISEKLHGTSHRVGRISYTEEQARFSMGDWRWKSRNASRLILWANKWLRRLFGTKSRTYFATSHGTRHAFVGTGFTGYYGDKSFRFQATAGLSPYENEIWYGEIVGYSGPATPIQKHSAGDKKQGKQWGTSIHYSYGNKPGECKFYVYRIIKMHETGRWIEYSWPQVERRALETGFAVAPQLQTILYDGDKETLNSIVDGFTNGLSPETGIPSRLDPTHPSEGVVVRVETPDGRTYWLKHKSWLFGALEGRNLEDGVVDIEEAGPRDGEFDVEHIP